MGKIYLGQVVTLQVDVNDPASIQPITEAEILAATTRVLHIKKSDGTIVLWSATPVAGTTKLEYTTTVGDFSVSGAYSAQSGIDFGIGEQRGETFSFVVSDMFQ
ncbi:MAG: hypothetical protein R8M45_10745 [Ghiorsea sp.]